jgi:hypothetical protein
MPFSLDGTSASLNFLGYPVTFHYSVKDRHFSPAVIIVNGNKVKFRSEDTIYRSGGAMIPADEFLELLGKGENVVIIEM